MSGWLKLHRSLAEWEWYTDPNTMRVFIHCLIKANHKDKNWRGIEIKRGQFISSLDGFSSELKLSIQQIRTSLKKLKATNEVTSKGGNQHTVFTVVSYDLYNQATDESTDEQQTDNKQITNDQQTDNKRSTATKNVKNENKVKNEENDKKDIVDFSNLKMSDSELTQVKEIRKTNKGGKITQLVVTGLSKQFELARLAGMTNESILTEWAMRGWKSFKFDWTDIAKQGQRKGKLTFRQDVNNITEEEFFGQGEKF